MTPAAVLLHGFTHTGASWDPVVAALPESYLAIASDLRGHGSAAKARPITLDAVIDDIEAIAPPTFALVGYSMGGRIALHAALRLPDRITHLVLIGASPGIGDGGERRQRRLADDRLADELEGLSIEVFAERWARTPVLADQPDQVRAAVHADRLRNTTAGLAAALRGLGTGALPSIWRKLITLEMPVTLVVGERDTKFRTIAGQMSRAIPAAEIVTVPRAGHAAHLEAPEAVAGVIASGTSR